MVIVPEPLVAFPASGTRQCCVVMVIFSPSAVYQAAVTLSWAVRCQARSYSGAMGSRMALVQSKRAAIYAAAARNRAESVAVFGSVARGEDTPASDIDFLVQFTPGASLMDLVRLQDELEALLGCRVDVVSVGGLKDRDEHIRREAVAV
jgi:predicted nucleotidyltransferase